MINPAPAAEADARAARLAAMGEALGVALGPAQCAQLARYVDLLQRWNEVYNLTAIRDPEQMLSHHLADALAVVPPLRRWTQAQATRVLDVGSGGGLPGVVLAVACPELQVTCVDTVAKKANFIRQVAVELRLPNLHAQHARVENLKDTEHYGLITARAFASLADLVTLTRHLLAPGGVWMAMKARQVEEEVGQLPTAVQVFHVEPLQVPGLDAQRCLVWMRPSEATSHRRP